MKTFAHDWRHSDYLNPGVLRLIDASGIRTVFELGAHDARDTVALAEKFAAQIHAFECHPGMLPLARERIRAHPAADRIHLVEKAAWDAADRIPFYPVVRTTSAADGAELDNPGASSCFRARDDYHRRYEQSVTEVEAVRLDAYCDAQNIRRIDLLCMDIQGAALHALRGLGEHLRDVRHILAELENRPLYHDQSLFPEVRDHLAAHGFRCAAEVKRDAWFSDYLFIARPAIHAPATRWRERLARLVRR
jgi:FkbM family methyltransferase